MDIEGHVYYHDDYDWYQPYWYGNSVYYSIAYPPQGYYYPSLPEGYSTEQIDGKTYYHKDGVYYTEGQKGGKKGYVVAELPEGAAQPQEVQLAAGPDPFEILRQMSDYIGKLEQFTVVSTDFSDEVLEFGGKVQLAGQRTVYVSRSDNRVAVEFDGAGGRRNVLYDGKTVTMLSRARKLYTVVKMPDTIEGMLDAMTRDYGITLPMADLLYPDLYEGLAARIQTGQYVGLHSVGTHECHHLAFSQEAIDWEVWIQTGRTPLLRKLTITYKDRPEKFRYMALLPLWKLSPPPAYAFELKLPAGAKKIEMLPVTAAE